VEWVGIIVFIVILFKTIERGGDWFDVLDGNARYGNWSKNFEFDAFFLVLCLLVFGGSAWMLIQAMKPETVASESYQPKPSVEPPRQVHHVHLSKSHTHNSHK